MLIRAGDLSERIELLAPSGTSVRLCASVRPISTREYIKNGAEIISETFTIMIRYRPGVSCANSVLWHGRYYNIINMEANAGLGYIILTVTLDPQRSETPYTETL